MALYAGVAGGSMGVGGIFTTTTANMTDTWIGEDEEAQAWNYLLKTRQTLAQYDIAKSKTTTPENLAKAQDFMYLAEGSDWFWWYGDDFDTAYKEEFDRLFVEWVQKETGKRERPSPSASFAGSAARP